MNDKCHFCGNKNFRKAAVQHVYRRSGKFLIVDDVPCEQCEFCGEQYFEGKVLGQIEEEFDRIHFHGKKPKREMVIPVEQFGELQYA